MMMFDGGDCSPAASGDEPFISSCMNTTSNKKKKSKNNKRRFTDEQIRSLESMFKNETRLEPRKKLQLAKELGLQPRQVAIWFQNKRARWKSKQLERDYSILRANYESLASGYESLKKEKQALIIQLQKLNEMMQRPAGDQEGKCCGKGESDNIEEDINKTKVCESEVLKHRLSFETSSEYGLGVLSDEDSSIKAEFFGLDEKEPNLISMVEVEPTDESLTTSRELNLDSDGLFDQPSSGCQWWTSGLDLELNVEEEWKQHPWLY